MQGYAIYQQARDAALAIGANAELIAKSYYLGESGLADSLSARRIAQEASLSCLNSLHSWMPTNPDIV